MICLYLFNVGLPLGRCQFVPYSHCLAVVLHVDFIRRVRRGVRYDLDLCARLAFIPGVSCIDSLEGVRSWRSRSLLRQYRPEVLLLAGTHVLLEPRVASIGVIAEHDAEISLGRSVRGSLYDVLSKALAAD